MLSNSEKDQIEYSVNNYSDDELYNKKENFISEAKKTSIVMGSLIDHGLINSASYKEHQSKLDVLVEYLVYIDGRIEGKNGWIFRSKRRIKWAWEFRLNK